jgi:hypothetical protein
MKSRIEIQNLLEGILGNGNVYFQDPPNTGMKYPCIIYNFEGFDNDFADNKPYIVAGRWTVHHMYKSIKNDLKEVFVLEPPFFKWERRIKNDGVYNDYYTLTI